MAYVYILQSLKNQRYYIGSTNDIKQRFVFHQAGHVRATKFLRPLQIVLQQEYPNIEIARKVERSLKNLKRRDYISKIIQDGKIKITGG